MKTTFFNGYDGLLASAFSIWLALANNVAAVPARPEKSPLELIAASDVMTNAALSGPVNLPLTWRPSLQAALFEAEASDKPALIFFRSSSCGWCARLRIEMESPDVRPLIEGFARAEVDVDRDRALALRLQVANVPTLVITGPDGREIRRINGFMPAAQLRGMLAHALSPAATGTPPPDLARRLEALDQGRPASNDWPYLLAAMNDTAIRMATRRYAATHGTDIRTSLVAALRHSDLVVRLGALDLLEELAGETYGFDPWMEAVAPVNAAAWQRWQAWQTETNVADEALYVSLSSERIESLLNDLVGTDRERAARAVRALTQAGASCSAALDVFAARHPELAEGISKRLVEVRLAVRMPVLPGIDSPALAHHLVFGTPDTRVRALTQLGRAGRPAAPVVRLFLNDADALIREAAVEAVVQAGGSDVAATLAAQTAHERNGDVLHALLAALAHSPGEAGGTVLCAFAPHADEALAIAALSGLPNVTNREDAQQALRVALDDPRWRVRVAALEAAAKMKPLALADRLEALTCDSDAFVRLNAVKALAVTKRQTAMTTLEKLFLKQDELKATVVGLVIELEKSFPASFGPDLRNKSADLLLGVLTVIQEHGQARHVPLVLPFTEHADHDVSCAALRIVARLSPLTVGGQAALLAALQSGDADRQLAVLENAALRVSSPPRGGAVAPVVLPPAAAVRSEVDALFDTVDTRTATPPPIDAPLPSMPSAPFPLATSEDLFGAFLVDVPPPVVVNASVQPATTAVAGQLTTAPRSVNKVNMDALVSEARVLMTRSADVRVRRAATVALATAGVGDALDRLTTDLDDLSVEQREQLARSFGAATSTNALALLRRLLRDPAQEVRKAALDATLSGETEASSSVAAPMIMDAAFGALSAPDALIQLTELPEILYTHLSGANPTRKEAVRDWAMRFIAPSQRESLQVLGFVLLAQSGQEADRLRVEERLKDDRPLIRRAVWRALACAWPDAFLRRVEEVAADVSPLVREVVIAAAAPKTYSSQWQVRFSAETVVRTYDYTYYDWSDTSAARATVPSAVVRQLWQKDKDAAIRVGAGLALLESRRSIDLGQLAAALATLPPGHRSRELTTRFMIENQKTLGAAFRVLLPYVEGDDAEDFTKLEHALGDNAAAGQSTNEVLFRARASDVSAPPALASAVTALPTLPASVRLVFFHQAGCQDCARVARWLAELTAVMPGVSIEEHDIGLQRAKELNEALGMRFEVPLRERLVAPSVFGGGGALVRHAITPATLRRLVTASSGTPLPVWYPSDTEVTAVAAPLRVRGHETGLPLMIIAGLFDGLNPCAFATLIFFISYLQLMRRTPWEMLRVGAAFISGVFLTYFAIGLGLREIVGRLDSLPMLALALKLVIAGLTLFLALLNLRDGVRCRQGRLADMTLQLPAVLKNSIHATIRGGVRLRRYVAAAFGMAVLVSVLELACTGQGYLPTIAYLWQTGYARPAMLALLAVYNLAFVAPLAIIFLLTYRGLRSETLVRKLNRHAAVVKFATAALFLVLFALLMWQVQPFIK